MSRSWFEPLHNAWTPIGSRIPRVTGSELNSDLLLEIFDWYRLYNTTTGNEDLVWNLQRWWYKPIQVCRKWRHLILSSPNRLDLHLVCTYGIPVEDMLSHSPPLPLIIYYPAFSDTISVADEEGIIYALQQPDRVRRIYVAAPTAVLCNLFKAMDCEFPILERLSLHLSTRSLAGLALPGKFLTPLLHHLTLSNISLPIQSQLLRQAGNLITLRLWNVPASPEFHPAHLVAQLPAMSRLETLVVQFYTPTPNRRFESPARPTPITLPRLKELGFQGGSTYLDGILARINAPFLSQLNVALFNQLTFNLSHLLQCITTSGMFSFRFAEIHFGKKSVSILADTHPTRKSSYPFLVKIKCKPLGWQAACAAEICHTLEPLLAGVENFTLGFHKDGSAPWQDEIDVELWHGLLRTFAGVKRLQLTGKLVENLFRLLQLDEGVLPLHLLPELPEAVPSAPDAQPTTLEEGLPPGWELREEPRGRTYYVDLNTFTATWNRPIHIYPAPIPTTQAPSAHAAETNLSPKTIHADSSYVDVRLPLGWERRLMVNGRPYFVNHYTRTTTWNEPQQSSASALTATNMALANRATLGPLPSGWKICTSSTRGVYFSDQNTRTIRLVDPWLPSMVEADPPQYMSDYWRKVDYLRSQPSMRLIADAKCDVRVRRGSIFEDSFAEIMRLRPVDLHKRLTVTFEGEQAFDSGGFSREWFLLISHEMFNPSYGLFMNSPHESHKLQINPASGVNPEHLVYFRFIGRVLGLAVFHRRFLSVNHVPGLYRVDANEKMYLMDLEAVDHELYKSLTWMLENDITDVLEKSFSMIEHRIGEPVVVELRPGGATQVVTEANKKQYVDLVVAYRTIGQIAEQLRAFMKGLGEVLPLDLLRVFDEHELDMLIGGMTEIDMDDWAQFTDYCGYEKTDQVIEWFWACLRSWPEERKARLLQFTTGTSSVPVNGFRELQGNDGSRRFTITKSGDPSGLISSRTCFNLLNLPPYEDYVTLERNLRFAIEETKCF